MSYLTRTWINPLRTQGRRLLTDPQALHAAVLSGIPSQPVKERVLWRTDTDNPHRPTLLVLSRSRPCLEHLVQQAGWPGADEPQTETRDLTPLLDRLADGNTYAFRLTANPTQSTRKPDKPTAAQHRRDERNDADDRRGHRVGHRTAAHQLQWLLDRSERWGCAIPPGTATSPDGSAAPDIRVAARNRVTFTRRNGATGNRVTLQVVTYEGHLTITDAAAFRDHLLAGFGKAKAYGCGLLTLAPSRR